MIRSAAKASISRTRSPSACCSTSSSNAILSSVIVISVFGFESCNPNLCRRSTVAASVTTGRAARATPGAPRAASYTNRWDTAKPDIEAGQIYLALVAFGGQDWTRLAAARRMFAD
jgi:hypothetical protein